jgi:hypothetical protein
VWCNGLAGSCGVGHGQDEPYRSTDALGQRDAFQLCCPQLRLKIAEAALDFDHYDLNRAVENHVSSSSIRRRGHRQLKADAPRLMRCGPDHFG